MLPDSKCHRENSVVSVVIAYSVSDILLRVCILSYIVFHYLLIARSYSFVVPDKFVRHSCNFYDTTSHLVCMNMQFLFMVEGDNLI